MRRYLYVEAHFVNQEFSSVATLLYILKEHTLWVPPSVDARYRLDLGVFEKLAALGVPVFPEWDETLLIHPYLPGVVSHIVFSRLKIQHPAFSVSDSVFADNFRLIHVRISFVIHEVFVGQIGTHH